MKAKKNKLYFNTPYINPFSYDHVICWFNGSIQHLISQDRAGSTNSMSLDYLIGEDAKLLNYERLKSETYQAIYKKKKVRRGIYPPDETGSATAYF